MDELDKESKGTNKKIKKIKMSKTALNLSPELKKIVEYWRLIVLVLFLALISWLSIFQISTEEVGVITRFGKYVRQVEPGLNLKIPFVEDVYKVPVERQQKLEFGFRTTKAGIDTQYSESSSSKDESLMLTGDLNLAEVQWVVQYRIDDAYKNLFKVRNPQSTLRIISEAAMRQIVGDRTVNEVLTVGRTEIANELEKLIQQICREYSMGIKIEQVVLQDVNPPEPVKAAFNAVNEAQQEKETLINEAKSEYNKVIPKARGQAEETIQQAEGYAAERVNNADGEATRFTALYNEFIKAPEVTKRRIYLETMSNVIPKIGNVVITDQKGSNVLPLLQMQMNKKTANNEN
jgi:membrane protease subunit HflK